MLAQNDKAPTFPAAPVKKGFISLVRTLSITFLTLIIIVILINNSLYIYFLFNREQSLVVSEQNSIARDAANAVKGFIDDKFSVMAQSAYVSDLISTTSDKQELVMNKLIGLIPSLRQLFLVDEQGKELQKVSRLSNPIQLHLTAADKDTLLSTVKRNNNYISVVYFDDLTQEPLIIIAIPTKNVFGDVKGALIGEVNLKFMWDLVSNMRIGNNGLAYVVDRKGNLLAFADVSRVLKRENLSGNTKVGQFITGKKEENSQAISVSKGIRGTAVVATFASLGFPDWAVVVEMPIMEAYKPLLSEAGLSILIILTSALGSIMLTIYLSKRLINPIIIFRNAANNISSGKLGTRVDIKSQDEIGDLATTFNSMVSEIDKARGDLEQKITERTQKLDQKVKELEKFKEVTVGRELKMIELKKEIERLEAKSPVGGKKEKL